MSAADPRGRSGGCPFRGGMESHIGPYADERGVIVKATSDAMFGPEGLGFASSPWMRFVSELARSGISEQTGSRPGETNVEGCVLGWGQGAFSSHVFRADGSIDVHRRERLIEHLRSLAAVVEGDPALITSATVAAFIGAQPAQPYLTHTGPRELKGWRQALSARFRGHIQWQSLVALCGQVNRRGKRVLTPALLRAFFSDEQSFFRHLVTRRRKLVAGELTLGAALEQLSPPDEDIDPVRTDRAYMARKSSLWLILKILWYMATRKGAGLPSL